MNFHLFSIEKISITVGEWSPYISENLENYGLATQIVSEASKLAGIEIEYVFLPWNRAYHSAKEGDNEATLLWVKTPEREKYFYFSDTIVSGTAVFFHLKNFPFKWKKLDDLADLRIGGLLSASYPWFEKAVKDGIDLKIELVTDDRLNFVKLLNNRIDIFSLDIYRAGSILKTSFTNDEITSITYNKKPIEEWKYCLLFSKKYKNSEYLTRLFNRGLRKLKKNNRYEEIINKFKISN